MINFTVLFCFIGLALSIPLGNHFRQGAYLFVDIWILIRNYCLFKKGQLFEGDIAGVDESVSNT